MGRVRPEAHHVLRHTLLEKLANQKGVYYAMESSGHRDARTIWSDVKPHREAMESLE